jgi:hypothetical protein
VKDEGERRYVHVGACWALSYKVMPSCKKNSIGQHSLQVTRKCELPSPQVWSGNQRKHVQPSQALRKFVGQKHDRTSPISPLFNLLEAPSSHDLCCRTLLCHVLIYLPFFAAYPRKPVTETTRIVLLALDMSGSSNVCEQTTVDNQLSKRKFPDHFERTPAARISWQ